MRKPLQRLLFAAGLVSLAILAVGGTPLSAMAVRAWGVSESLQPAQADAIVVIGGGVVWPGELMPDSVQRIQHGVRLYRAGFAPLLVVSGGAPPQVPTEAALMAQIAIDMGVPREAVLQEPLASRTRENGTRVARLLEERGARSIILVTNALHMRRARAVFESVGLTTRPAASYTPGWVYTTPGTGVAALEELAYEVAAMVLYWWKGWI
jgi:uncharacterized SAM-binding protein YcdF (DUF218 family)